MDQDARDEKVGISYSVEIAEKQIRALHDDGIPRHVNLKIRIKLGRFFIPGKEGEDILSWKVFCRLSEVSCLHIINTFKVW